MKARTVVIIEDNEQNLYLMRFLLEKNGFVVKEARDGHQGLTLAKQVNPDLILLDIQLPDLDGYAVAQRLRQQESLRETPIIVVTSYAMVGDREKALAAGATGYIEKPINPDIFVEQLRAHVPAMGEELP
jgi:two-component system, cell cycle response regulator DivK